MKRFFPTCLIVLMALATFSVSYANPFRHRYVCVPDLKNDSGLLEFSIRDGGPCTEDETWREVQVEPDGTVLLMPSEGPPNPEEKKDLDHFKSYYGIIR